MFSENHTESSSEPGFDRDITLEGVPGQSKMANTDKEPSAEEKLNPEPSGSRIDKELSDHKPGTDDDIDVPQSVRRMTPSSFFWTKDFNGKPVLKPHPHIATYLATASRMDQNPIDELANKDELRKSVRTALKSFIDLGQSLAAMDQSGWEFNTLTRFVNDLVGQSACETVYWKDQLAEIAVRCSRQGKKVSEDRGYQALSNFKDNGIRRHYLYQQVSIALDPKGTPAIDLERAARSFLGMRAAMETKRLLGTVTSAALENSLDSEAAAAIDPQAAARAELLKQAMATKAA